MASQVAERWDKEPRCFRLLTINTTHCKNLEKLQKAEERWDKVPDGPQWNPMAGAMGHGPQCFRLLTNNTTHCKNLEKLQKVAGYWDKGPPMNPDIPNHTKC